MNTLTFHKISSAYDPALNLIKTWYETAFPIEERREFEQLLSMLNIPEMSFCGILTEQKLIGFLIYWKLENGIYFLEHLCIDQDQRGKRYGNKTIAHLLRLPSHYFVLEVEPPHDDISQRRIEFYKNQGFSSCASPYFQPPYINGHKPIPMRLMSIPEIKNENDFNRITSMIKTQVYERFYTNEK